MNYGYNEYVILFFFIVILGVLSFFYSKYKSKHLNSKIDTHGCKPEVFHLSENIYTYHVNVRKCLLYK